MHRILAAVVAVSWLVPSAAMADPATVTVPIAPAPIPDARSLSQINPTAGPAMPPKSALKPTRTAGACATVAASAQQRETTALNDLAAAGYGQFRDLHEVGHDYQATVDDPRGTYTVTVDPDSGRITPPSAAADRETRALNLLADRGYVQVNAILPAGTDFVAWVTEDGRVRTVTVDPDSGRIMRGD